LIEFPITDLLDGQSSYEWLLAHFHPEGLQCPHCEAAWSEAREFRWTKKSQVPDYRCGCCEKTYNVYSQTVFEGRHFTPEQAVMLVRGIVKGEQAQILANEVGVCRHTVQAIRKLMHLNAERHQPETALEDEVTETDEMFQNAGEKRGLAWRSN
jgi:transposase-like protein